MRGHVGAFGEGDGAVGRGLFTEDEVSLGAVLVHVGEGVGAGDDGGALAGWQETEELRHVVGEAWGRLAVPRLPEGDGWATTRGPDEVCELDLREVEAGA